jgi:hypothetical protein
MPAFEPNPRTEPTIVQGARGPESHVTQRVVMDMKDTILLYQPTVTPFMTVTAKIKGKRKAFNRKFEWLEKDFKPRSIEDTAGIAADGVTLTVSATDGDKLAANDVIKNLRTGDIALVTAESAGTVTIVRDIGGTGQVGNAGDTWIILGSSYPDYSTIGSFVSITEYPNYNYTQIFRTPFGFTGRDLVTELYGGNDKMTETKWQGIEHKKSIEYSLLFGKRHVIAASGSTHERTFTGGLEWAVKSNVWDVSGVTLGERAFDEFLEEGLRWGKGGRQQGGTATKYLFCSSRWLTEINGWAKNKLEYRVLDKSIGFTAKVYNSPHGDVMLLPDVLLDEYHPDMAFLVDVNHVDYAYLRQRDTKLLTGREANDLDGESYEYFSDVGLQVEFEQSHSILRGLSA